MNSPLQQPQRVLGLDVFRGITMAFMVLVGNPGSLSIYSQLDHAAWNGWTLTDVVFPTFLWIVGASISLSIGRKTARGESRLTIVLQAFKRSAILYAIGVFIYAIGSFDLSTLRLLGVLQRVAICSFISTLIYLCASLRKQLVVVAVLLVSYWLILVYVPVPGYGPGDLGIEGNVAHYVDRIVLGSHNYSGTGSWDPEGLLSTIPAIATTLLGVIAGELLRRKQSLNRHTLQMLALGVALALCGLIASHWMPINKKLWTDSFCLLMAGIDFAVFAALHWIIDGHRRGKGLALPLAFGQNALAVYVISEVSGAILWSYPHSLPMHGRIFSALFGSVRPAELGSLLYALSTLAVIAAAAFYMHRRNWIVRI